MKVVRSLSVNQGKCTMYFHVIKRQIILIDHTQKDRILENPVEHGQVTFDDHIKEKNV